MKPLKIILTAVVLGIVVALGIVLGQGVAAKDFGFEKNIDSRKGADAESVAGCMQSCEDMLAGWLEMNPNSPNYTRQAEKIQAKSEQCLAMNELAGSPFSEAEILASCGQDQCLTDADCDDGNSCTVNNCIIGPSRFGQGNTCVAGNVVGFPPGTPVDCSLNGTTGVCADGQCVSSPSCTQVSQEDVDSGACGPLSLISDLGLPQCCAVERGPSGDVPCGTESEWVVGVAAFPVCYIPGS